MVKYKVCSKMVKVWVAVYVRSGSKRMIDSCVVQINVIVRHVLFVKRVCMCVCVCICC